MTDTTANRDSATTDITRRVASGVDLLDRKRPGWDQVINLSRLNIASFSDCVLGQLYGDFDAGYNTLRLAPGTANRLGFDRRSDEFGEKYTELTAEWKRVIRARRGAVA